MKSTVAGIGSFVPAGAAVVGSVALSLVILHPPPAGLLPGVGTAPADRQHVTGALVLPALHAARSRASTQLETPRPAPTTNAAVTTPRRVAHPTAPSAPPGTPSPPRTQTIPTPATEPVTTPVTTPVTAPVTTPVTTPSVTTPRSHTNNGRWKSQKAKTWKAAASKQNTRTQKGKPPWAGQGNDHLATTRTPPAVAPDTSKKTPPGQAKKTPPGQTKKTPPGQTQTPPDQTQAPPEQTATPPRQDKTPPGQEKKGQSPPG